MDPRKPSPGPEEPGAARAHLKGRSARGLVGERLAALYLGLRGYRLVARRRRVAGVEVDLVVRRGNIDALVEVKTRLGVTGPEPGDLDRLVSPGQRARLARAARAWADRLALNPLAPVQVVRVDVVDVRLSWRGWPSITHHVDVLRSPG